MNNEPIETQAVVVHEPEKSMPLAKVEQQRPSAQEMRVSEVTEALLPAYQKASTLELTDQEVAQLMEPFPDSTVDIRPHDGLLFISHIHVSNRLNRIFKPGKWALIRRREWFDDQTSVVYGEYVLVIRGCYVGESVGGHQYVANNPKTNYSDALESTAAEALRRICGKRLSCGSQVWDSDYCRKWMEQHAEQDRGKWRKRATANRTAAPPSNDPQPIKTAPTQPQEVKKATTEQVLPPKIATEATKAWFLDQLRSVYSDEDIKTFFEKKAFIIPTEKIEDVPLRFVPISRDQMARFSAEMAVWAVGSPPASFDEEEPEFFKVVITIPRRGMKKVEYDKQPDTIGSLYRAMKAGDETAQSRLFGIAHNFEVKKTWTGNDNKEHARKPSEVLADEDLRTALNEFLSWAEERKEQGD